MFASNPAIAGGGSFLSQEISTGAVGKRAAGLRQHRDAVLVSLVTSMAPLMVYLHGGSYENKWYAIIFAAQILACISDASLVRKLKNWSGFNYAVVGYFFTSLLLVVMAKLSLLDSVDYIFGCTLLFLTNWLLIAKILNYSERQAPAADNSIRLSM